MSISHKLLSTTGGRGKNDSGAKTSTAIIQSDSEPQITGHTLLDTSMLGPSMEGFPKPFSFAWVPIQSVAGPLALLSSPQGPNT